MGLACSGGRGRLVVGEGSSGSVGRYLRGDPELWSVAQYACWCENTAGAKAAGIVMLQSEVVQLTQDVLELKGQVAVS